MSELEIVDAVWCKHDQELIQLLQCVKCPYHKDQTCSYSAPVSVVMLAERSKLVEPRSRW